MGKHDYLKSYSRQMETIVTAICAVYCFTELFIGHRNNWNPWGQVAVLGSMLISWIYFFGKYQTYEIRAFITCVTSQIMMAVYAIEVGDFYSIISVYISVCIVLGLYGIPSIMLIPNISYTGVVLYYIFVDGSLAWGTYDTDWGMITRILQPYVVIFVVFYLVYRYKVTQESMMEMIDALKKSEREKDDFLANVSHEIRTPINTICGISELMLKKEMDPVTKENILNIQSAGRNLTLVVGDILDYSELQEGGFEIVEENYYVSSTINDIINMSVAKKSEKNLELIVNCEPDIPTVLIGDEQKIRRVVMNLVNNAIEFTEQGCVVIEFGSRREDYGVNLMVTVRDTGIGMSKASVEKLFRKFSQVDMGRTRKNGGVGLGLAIAQTIVKKMGGFITVSSELGKGSEFRVIIPQKIADEKPIATIPNGADINAAVYVNMEQFHISAIRDEYSNTLKAMVGQAGVKCRVFRNLTEFKRWIKRENYNQIFITWIEYQEDPAFFDNLSMQTHVHVILDYNDDAKVQNKLLSKIYKPFYILSIVSSLKNQEKEGDGIEYQEDDRQIYAPDAHVLVIDDNQMNIRVVEGLLKEYGMKVSSALSGREGVELLTTKKYDLVLLDHMMPEMDGVETLHNIRRKQDPYFKNVPVLALTANAVAGAREMLIKEGFDDFLAKPLENSVLQRALKRHLPKDKLMVKKEEARPETPKEETVVIRQNLVEEIPSAPTGGSLVIGDLDISKGILYCGNEKNYINILKSHKGSGKENMEHVHKLFLDEDWKNYTIVVHGIKSSMMSIGAVALSEMAKALEFAGKREDILYIRDSHQDMINEYQRVMDILNQCPLLGTGEEKESPCNKEEVPEELFCSLLKDMENVMYDLDGEKMKEILNRLSSYSYGGKDLNTELQPVYKKVEMSDFMSAYDTVVKIKDRIKKV